MIGNLMSAPAGVSKSCFTSINVSYSASRVHSGKVENREPYSDTSNDLPSLMSLPQLKLQGSTPIFPRHLCQCELQA